MALRPVTKPKRKTGGWRAVRIWEVKERDRIRSEYTLVIHGWCIGALVLLAMWGVSAAQYALGSESLALRYAVTLGAGYLLFLGILRVWAASLARGGRLGDVPDPGAGGSGGGGGGKAGEVSGPQGSPFRTGQGGDFGGGGAHGDFDMPGEAVGAVADAGSAAGELASGALEGLAAADEGAVVVIPVVAIFLVGSLVLFGAGSLLWLFFGSEVLLAVAVELAFGFVSARAAVGVARAGWLDVAIGLTWKPLAGALFCAVLLGATIDYFLPQARSLPAAVKMLRAR